MPPTGDLRETPWGAHEPLPTESGTSPGRRNPTWGGTGLLGPPSGRPTPGRAASTEVQTII